MAKYEPDVVHPVSDVHLSQVRLMRAIERPWVVVVVHNHLEGTSQIVGNSMIVGINTFSIAGG